jgi:hypothetical protein
LKTNLEACAARIARNGRQRSHASRSAGYDGVRSRFADLVRDDDLDLAPSTMRDDDLDLAPSTMRDDELNLAPPSVRNDNVDLAPRSMRETTAFHFALRGPRDRLTESNRPVSIRELVGC